MLGNMTTEWILIIEAEWRKYALVIKPSLVQIMACLWSVPSHYLSQSWNIGPLGTNISEILINIRKFSVKKMNLKVSSAKRQPFYLSLNLFNDFDLITHQAKTEWKH